MASETLKRFCVIKSCKNFNGTTDKDELFFSAPNARHRNVEFRKKWITAIEVHQQIDIVGSFQLCSRHFDPQDILKSCGLLKLNAIPKYFDASENNKHENKNKSESMEQEISRLKVQNTFLSKSLNYYKSMFEKLSNSAKVVVERCDDHSKYQVNAKPVGIKIEPIAINMPEPAEISDTEVSVDLPEIESFVPPEDPVLKPFKCGKCEENFATGKELSAHMKSHWPTAKTFKCDICDGTYTKSKELLTHMKLHEPSKSKESKESKEIKVEEKLVCTYECHICKSQYESKAETRKHIRIHYRRKPCTVCGLKLNENEFPKHLCVTNEKTIDCEYCTNSFTTTISLLEHLDTHEEKMYKCDKCPIFFAMLRLKTIHMDNHKSTSTPKFKCRICSKGFDKRYRLEKHILVQHSIEKPYLCDECGKSFEMSYNLRIHKRIHNEPKYSCPDCPRMFYSATGLKSHSDIHKSFKYVCTSCNAELISRKAYRVHMLKHESNQDRERKYNCDMCPWKFFRAKELKNHKRIHSGNKDFHCDYCEKSYVHPGDLNKHLRTHLGDLIHECDVCSKKFRLPRELLLHSFEHYKEQKEQMNNETSADNEMEK